MRNFSDEQGRTRVFVEAYRSYSADGNPRRTPLSGKRAIYGWNLEPISKMWISVQGKARGGPPSLKKLWRDKRKNAAYTAVCEHFEPTRNAAMET
jgi:hypothetical protein